MITSETKTAPKGQFYYYGTISKNIIPFFWLPQQLD